MNKITRFILSSLCFLTSLGITAQTFEVEGIWYNVIDTKSVAVAPPSSGYYEGSVEIPGSINYTGRDYSVTKIAAYAFRESTDFTSGIHKLTSVTMANNIIAIEESAFENCINLQSVKISNRTTYVGVNAFANCSSMTSVTLSSNLEEIRDGAFMNCKKIGQISLGSKLKKIGNNAFNGCTTLSVIDIPNAVTSIGNGAFKNCSAVSNVKFGNEVEKIGEGAFENCTGLKTIVLPNKLSTISPSTFAGCSILSSVTFGSALTTISDKAFYGCKSINELTIPSSVVEIGESSFGGCDGINTLTFADSSVRLRYGNGNFITSPIEKLTLGRTLQYTSDNPGAFSEKNRTIASLKRVEITSTVSALPSAIFRGCKVLNNVTIADGLTEIGSRAFESCEALTSIRLPNSVERIMSDGFAKCYYLADFNLPSKVTVIEIETFFECRSLTTMNLSNVIEIKSSAFQECDRLKDITLSSNLRSIGQNAFNTCMALRSITIPENVREIESGAFFESGLEDIISKASNPPAAENDTWDDNIYEKASVTVPSKSYDKYRNAKGWNNFAKYTQVKTFAVTVNPYEGGSVLLNGVSTNAIELKENQSVKIDVIPATGRIIESASYTMGSKTKSFSNTTTISPVSDNVTVNVNFGYIPPTSISFSESVYYIKPDETVQLSVLYTPEDSYAPVAYSIVSGNEVVSLDDSCVKGLNGGVAIIRATTAKGLMAECTVYVNDGSVHIDEFSSSKYSRYEPIKCTVSGAPVDQNLIKWECSDKSNFIFFDNGVLMYIGDEDHDSGDELNVEITATLPDGQVVSKTTWLSFIGDYSFPIGDNNWGNVYIAVAPYEVMYYADINSDCVIPASVSHDGFKYSVTAAVINHSWGDEDGNYSLTLPSSIRSVKIDDNFINQITCYATIPPVGSVGLWEEQKNTIFVPSESVDAYKASKIWNPTIKNPYLIRAIGQNDKIWNINIHSNTGGSVSLNGKKNVTEIENGTKLTIDVTPDPGYTIGEATYRMGDVNGSFTTHSEIASVTDNVEVYVEFIKQYTITVKSNAGGKVYVGDKEFTMGGSTSINDSETIDIMVVPDRGYVIESADYQMGSTSQSFDDRITIWDVHENVEINVTFALSGSPVDPPVGPDLESVTFDFSQPALLNPSQSPNTSNSPICEVSGIKFIEKNISLTTTGGSTSARLWYYGKNFQYRIYNDAIMTISVTDNSSIITGFSVTGSQINTLQCMGTILESGQTYKIDSNYGIKSLDIRCISNGTNKRADITSITVHYLSTTGIEDIIVDGEETVEVYTLHGHKVAESLDGLAPGIYIVKRGNKTSKVAIY